MAPNEGHEPNRFRKLAIPAVICGSLVLIAVLLLETFWRSTTAPVPGGAGAAGASSRDGGLGAPARGVVGGRDDATGRRGGSGAVATPPEERSGESSSTPRYVEEKSRWAPRPSGRARGLSETPPEDLAADGAAWTEDVASRSALSRSGGSPGGAAPGGDPGGTGAKDERPHPPPAAVAGVEGASAAAGTKTDPSGGAESKTDNDTGTSEAPTDPESDRDPPVLVSIRTDPPQIVDGSASTVIIEARDDLSGVQSVAGRLRSPGGKALIPFEAQAAGGTSFYSAVIRIPAKAETGVWYVSDLFIYDQARNPLIANFNGVTAPAGARLTVTSAESDSTPPSVRDVWIDPSTVSGGETAKVSIDIEDDSSGVANIWGTFRSRSGTGILNFTCRPQGASPPGPGPAVWEGVLPVPANADCGEWSLQQLWVVDKASNTARLASETPPVAQASFYVSSDVCDSSAPVLEWIQLSPATVSNETPTEVVLTAGVHDEGTGTIAMQISITGPMSTNGQAPRISIQGARASAEPDAPWIGRIAVPQFAAKGTWSVVFVRLQDRASNIRDYRPDAPELFQAAFEVR